MPLTPDERSSIIALAMERKFGDLLIWKRPELAHIFGANDFDQVDYFEMKLGEVRDEVIVALEHMSDDSLNDFQSMISDHFRISESNVDAVCADRIGRLHRIVPPPVAYGFGHPSYTAKFDHWARMPRLSLHSRKPFLAVMSFWWMMF